MQIENYLKKHQPIIYQTFVNALTNDQLSHAYLLLGNPGSPLLEIAKFFAKSILCDNPSPLACDNCITCLRVDEMNYPDLIVLDGSKTAIKKSQINEIEDSFEKEAFENKGIRIYILHIIETMDIKAINSILKFLEEPGSKIYAFLTSNNDSAVLPTIMSRCQILRMKQANRQDVINEATDLGIDKQDAELLSYCYNDAELISETLQQQKTSDEDDFHLAKQIFEGFLQALKSNDKNEILFYVETNATAYLKSKESLHFFFDMLTEAFEDIVNIKHHTDIFLSTYKEILVSLASSLKYVDECLLEILKCHSLITAKTNIPLLLDHMAINLKL